MAAPTALLGELREIRGVIAAVLPGADPALQRALRHLDRRAARLERLALLRPRLAGLLGRRVAQLRGALAALLSGDGSGGFSGGTEIPGRDKDSS